MKIKQLLLWFLLKPMRRWKHRSPKTSPPVGHLLAEPAAPAALNKWPVLYQAPERYKDAFTLWQFLEGVTSAESNQCFPWLSQDSWEQAPKCGGISAGEIPAAPDCACSFRRAPWWAIAAMVLPPNPRVWHTHVTAVCQVCPEALMPGPVSVLVGSRTLCVLFIFLWENLHVCELHLHLLIS